LGPAHLNRIPLSSGKKPNLRPKTTFLDDKNPLYIKSLATIWESGRQRNFRAKIGGRQRIGRGIRQRGRSLGFPHKYRFGN
jgi:hypothetical protein